MVPKPRTGMRTPCASIISMLVMTSMPAMRLNSARGFGWAAASAIDGGISSGLRRGRPYAPSARFAEHGKGGIRCFFEHLEKRACRSARRALALLPIAHGLDRHADTRGEGSLREP